MKKHDFCEMPTDRDKPESLFCLWLAPSFSRWGGLKIALTRAHINCLSYISTTIIASTTLSLAIGFDHPAMARCISLTSPYENPNRLSGVSLTIRRNSLGYSWAKFRARYSVVVGDEEKACINNPSDVADVDIVNGTVKLKTHNESFSFPSLPNTEYYATLPAGTYTLNGNSFRLYYEYDSNTYRRTVVMDEIKLNPLANGIERFDYTSGLVIKPFKDPINPDQGLKINPVTIPGAIDPPFKYLPSGSTPEIVPPTTIWLVSPKVPEPSSILSLLALGTLGAASTLKRKLKPSQLTEKETTKVS